MANDVDLSSRKVDIVVYAFSINSGRSSLVFPSVGIAGRIEIVISPAAIIQKCYFNKNQYFVFRILTLIKPMFT